MVYLTTIHIHPNDFSYLGTLFQDIEKYVKVDTISVYNYFSAKDTYNFDPNVKNYEFSMEPTIIERDIFRIMFGNIQTDLKKRKIWFPFLICRNPEEYVVKRNIEYSLKNKFCAFAVSNDKCPMRNNFFKYVCDNYKKVDSLGKHLKNTNEELKGWATELTFINNFKKYKFMICFENESSPFYITEKLGNAYLAGCIPIYWGMKDVDYIINPKCFIHIRDETDFKEALERIKFLDSNEEEYKKMLNEPFFMYNKVPFCFTKEYYIRSMLNIEYGIPFKTNNKKRVISYSLYGTGEKYIKGAIRNAELAPLFYPGFECWFYTDKNVDKTVVEKLKTFDYVKIIDVDVSIYPNINFAKSLRFLPMDDPEVELMLSRDTDSRFSIREANAVYEWISSGKTFHIMRDHPQGHSCKILGGAWGSRKIPNFNFEKELESWKQIKGLWDVDQRFMIDMVYPLIKNDSVIHAQYFKFEEFAKDFPDPHFDRHFVGEYINFNGDREVRGEDYKSIPE